MAATGTVGIDIGGTGIKGAAVDLSTGELATERVKVATPRPATPDAVAAAVVGVLGTVGVGGPVGITLPAVVQRGVVRTAANIDASFLEADAAALFASSTGRAVHVLNDADAAGMAEMRYGAGKGEPGVVVMVTLGTGIGCAVFHDGVLLPNTELGHLPLHHGDAEAWAAESARERDDLSWSKWAARLSEYFELLERLLWPGLFIIGGGISRKSDKFVPLLTCRTRVVAATMHNDAGIVGAAMAAPAT